VTLAELTEKRAAVVKTARDVRDAAKRDGRDLESLTTEELGKIDEALTEVRRLDEMKDAAKADQARRDELSKLFDGAGGDDTTPSASGAPVGKTLGDRFVASDQYKQAKERGFAQGEIAEAEFKALHTEFKTVLTEGAGSGANLLQPDVRPGVLPLLFWPTTIAALIPQAETDSITVRYLSETTFTNAAATVAEGALKPESALVFTQTDEPVRKIAHYLPATEEMLADVPAIRDYINQRLILGVQLTEETQLLTGSGTPPDLTGILNRAGLQTAQARGTDTNVDAIYKQITNIRVNSFVEPDGLVIHPTNWQTVRLSKDAQGQYYAGGPFMPGFAPTLWGLRVIVTPRITANTALVGAFGQAAQIFRRGGLELASSNSHNDYFVRNQVAIRAEQREALAVYRPGAFGTVTGLN
jgi:HK97 family phage major capsid protein